MILKRLRYKKNGKHLRLRVESCVNTVLELNQRLGEGKIKREIVQQFERLRESLMYVTDETVDERDISRIEDATNQLLAEIRTAAGTEKIETLHLGPTH
jgi:hypothetical protein